MQEKTPINRKKSKVTVEDCEAAGVCGEQVRPVCFSAAFTDDTPAGLGGAETGGRSLTEGRRHRRLRSKEERVRSWKETHLDSDYRRRPEQPPKMSKQKEYNSVKISK